MVDIIARHLAAFSSSSWTDYQATLTNDAVYNEMPNQERVVGSARCVTAARRWKHAFPDVKATILRSYHLGDRVICECEWQGTQRGPFAGVFGMLPPMNRHWLAHFCSVFTLRNGKICESRHYFDMLAILLQLGITTSIGVASPMRRPADVGTRSSP